MNDRYKWITLAQKIKELSEKGEGGEKLSAELHLRRLMLKYNITLEELQANQRKDFDIEISNNIPNKFVTQVLSSIIGKISKYGSGVGLYKSISSKTKRLCILNIEPTLFYEFKYKLDFYWKDYNAQLENFYDAYVQKNRLYSKPDENQQTEKDRELTEKEIQEMLKVVKMMDSIDVAFYQKQLDNGKS